MMLSIKNERLKEIRTKKLNKIYNEHTCMSALVNSELSCIAGTAFKKKFFSTYADFICFQGQFLY